MTSLLAQQVRLDEHARRLNGHDDEFQVLATDLTLLRLQVAKLFAYAVLIFSLVSAVVTAASVHYLTPSPQPAPVAARR